MVFRKRKEVTESDDAEECYATALRALSVRGLSAKALRTRLRRAGFVQHVVDSVLTRLEGQKLLSDASYAESYARSRLRRNYGSSRIARELQQRGVGEVVAAEALEAGRTDEDEPARLAEACEKKLKALLRRSPIEEVRLDAGRKKIISHLLQRGYALHDVLAVVGKALSKNSDKSNER